MLKRSIPVLLVVLLAAFAFDSSTVLAADAPGWNITAEALPTNFTPNGTGIPIEETNGTTGGNTFRAKVRNLGDTTISGQVKPIIVSVNVSGVTAVGIGGPGECQQPAGPCTYTGALEPGQTLEVDVTVSAGASGTSGTGTTTVSGGETAGLPIAPATASQPLTVSSTPAPFGIEPGSLIAEFSNRDGGPETQADAHPYDLTVGFAFNSLIVHGERYNPSQDVKDIAVELPSGIVGNELAVEQCPSRVLETHRCPGSSQVGTSNITISGGVGLGGLRYGLFNMNPDNGHTNELGFFTPGGFSVHQPTSVRTRSDYGITNVIPKIPNSFGSLTTAEEQLWGVPADASHTPQRVLAGYLAQEFPGTEPLIEEESGGHPSPLPPTAFLTMPSQCGKPLVFKLAFDSYVSPGRFLADGEPDLSDQNWKQYTVSAPAMTGCEKLQSFTPHITVAPDTTDADTPAGTTVEVNVPQGEGLTKPEALSASTLKNTTVVLPAGMVINPGQANGLGACQPSEDGVGTSSPPSCPGSSKVGSVEIETPLLPDRLVGNVYVLQSNPPNLQLLLAASADDVNLKLLADVSLNEATGQLTTTLKESPSFPFTHFRLIFSGGAQAALMTPPSCGVYATMADFTPWSGPLTPDFLSADGFGISAGPNGSACHSPLPFAPSMIAGSTTDQAGGYSSFSLLLQRGDGEQRIGGLQFKTPEGLLGMISKISLCEEPQAAAGTCSSASQIGHTVVGAGAGPDPLYVPEPGQAPAPIYLTGPYKGAPFGLSIVVPVIAGPFNLGTVVVRATINVDPITSRLTISTDPVPQILDGIPTDLRSINTVIDRPGFIFNPTNCAPMEFSGIAQSAQGTIAPISSHYQVGSCRSLKFKPDLRVSTSGKTSRANGASLDAKVIYPTGPLGENQASSQSNIASVKVDLPKQLPSRLTTLQKACPAATFAAGPADCPAASKIGVVKAITPVLPVPLTGPVYFVSHGGEAFPSLVAILQGYGVRVDLVASTFIANGITSSTFQQVPDVPISSFELYLPQGPYSALTANGDLCKSKLTMPTTFTAQNGALIHQATPITVTGCKAKASRRRAHRARKSSHAGHGRSK